MALPFYQPVDYTRNQPQQPKFDFMKMMSQVNNMQQQQQQQERGQQFQQALGGVEGQPLDYGQLMQKFPEQADLLIKMENQQQFRNQLQNTNAGADAVNLYRALDRGDNQGAAAIISQNANDINGIGDPSFTADSAMQMLQNNPEQLKSAALNIARMSGGQEAFLENIQGQQPEPMTAYQQAMIQGKGVDQELRRLELEDKQLDRQYDRSKDDLERIKVQQQIDEVNRKKTEALEAKEKGKNEAVTTTQQTLESVNNLLGAAGLEEAVGVGASFPTFAGTEAADFETALDSFCGEFNT